MRLVDELNVLHDSYVTSINLAVEENDLVRAEQLAQAYDDEAITLIATREGKLHLLPLVRPARVDTPLRRWVARLRAHRAA
jgi:hypothetical protein